MTSVKRRRGNEFEYYVPNGAVKVFPVAKLNGAGKPHYPQPWRDYIKGKFVPTKTAPFGSKGKLKRSPCVLRDIQLVCAALECGYGRRSGWSVHLMLNPSEAVDLTRYLVARLEMVAACIETDRSGARIPRSFFHRVESSEKVALSFILGGIGTHLAAREWLRAGGDPMKSFLHAGIYLKAAIKSTASSSSKRPDFLVESRAGYWHVFESKGGNAASKWARIVEGLVQLASTPKVGTSVSTLKAPTSCVVVHTGVDSGERLRITAVDPPADSSERQDGRPNPQPEEPLVLVPSVYRLLLVLETLEQFRALSRDALDVDVPLMPEWEVRSSLRFGGLVVAVPSRFLRYEDEVRRLLAVFLTVRDFIRVTGEEQAVPALDSLDAVSTVLKRSLSEVPLPAEWLAQKLSVLSTLSRIVLGGEFVQVVAKSLGLDDLAESLAVTEEELRLVPTSDRRRYEVTSGGMLLLESGLQLHALERR